ncbi:MAG TPA: ATP-binding cassette domain-containing protein [Solirubrobacteraceae bacterium]|jgi:ABC-2 type transport system ATP-binding protein
MTTNAIEAEGLHKTYGETEALRGVDLAVPRGSVCGLLGPNGAGKTTAVRILTTLSVADAGWARVAGHDVAQDPLRVRRRIGLASQDATVDGLLSGRQNLVLVGELHHLGRRFARRRADELLEQFSLTDAADRLVRDYSGGMRRRLDLAATLVAGPEVLFLDEPTTGLDPRARNELWAVLDTLVDGGTTLLLTTQYLEEADRLADEIVVVDHGLVIARGDSRSLKRQVGGAQIAVVLVDGADLPRAAAVLERVTGAAASVEDASRRAAAPAESGVEAIAAVAAALQAEGIAVEDLGLHQPTLDDVFLTLTGSGAGGEPAAPALPTPEEALR